MNILEKTYVLDEIPEVAQLLSEILPLSRVVAFEGELGAGKTTLIAEICRCLQVKDSVGSPTFSIINEYEGVLAEKPLRIYHIDLYRLADEEEARHAGIEDCIYGDGISFVEWPSKVPSVIPDDALHVELSHMPDGERHIVVRSIKND
jgi:tRNA threonylcarbamoyladenosine biosynthesis protein TsaE